MSRQDIIILMVMNLLDPYVSCGLFPVFVVKSPAETLPPNVKYHPNETLHIGSLQLGVQWGIQFNVGKTTINHPANHHKQVVYTIPKWIVYHCFTHITDILVGGLEYL